jgi:hypothetical protein
MLKNKIKTEICAMTLSIDKHGAKWRTRKGIIFLFLLMVSGLFSCKKNGKRAEAEKIINRLLSIFIEMFRSFVLCMFGKKDLLQSGIILKTYNDAALLSAIPNGKLRTPICKTLFQLGKNNLDTFGGCQKFFPVLATHNPQKTKN